MTDWLLIRHILNHSRNIHLNTGASAIDYAEYYSKEEIEEHIWIAIKFGLIKYPVYSSCWDSEVFVMTREGLDYLIEELKKAIFAPDPHGMEQSYEQGWNPF